MWNLLKNGQFLRICVFFSVVPAVPVPARDYRDCAEKIPVIPVPAGTEKSSPGAPLIVIQVKKVIRNVEISCFSKKGQKRSRKPLFTIFSVIFFRGRLLRFHHLLLQFLTDLDNSGCILFTIGWTSFCAIRILNFYLKTKWRPFHFDICCKKHFFSVCKLSGGAILVWDKNSKFWSHKS